MQPIIIENYLATSILNAVAATWPADDWPHWHRYDDRHARGKLASKDAHRLPDAARYAINEVARLNVPYFASAPAAFVDFDLHGAGLHVIPPGGRLGRHLDGEIHPLTGWKREANAVLFIDDWKPTWGGQLEFFDAAGDASEPHTSIAPQKNRLVLFATAENAWHQVAQVTGPRPRRTLSLFWWSEAPTPVADAGPANAGAPVRDRAQFAGL